MFAPLPGFYIYKSQFCIILTSTNIEIMVLLSSTLLKALSGSPDRNTPCPLMLALSKDIIDVSNYAQKKSQLLLKFKTISSTEQLLVHWGVLQVYSKWCKKAWLPSINAICWGCLTSRVFLVSSNSPFQYPRDLWYQAPSGLVIFNLKEWNIWVFLAGRWK